VLSEDPDPAIVPELLVVLDHATAALIRALEDLEPEALTDASLLGGWTRGHVVAHLANVADALVHMTGDALAGAPMSMYPGGRLQRDRDIGDAARAPASALCDRCARSAAQLSAAWHAMTEGQWVTAATGTELGSMQLGRLVALRLTEVEVHHADLAVGFGPYDWSRDFVRACLPLRVAALARARRRADADHAIDGTWVLVCDELESQWSVTARGDVVDFSGTESADVVLSGSAGDLVAFLLGRANVEMLAVGGDVRRAELFKRAFPGP
jgi:maleylpyruvate isomerase